MNEYLEGLFIISTIIGFMWWGIQFMINLNKLILNQITGPMAFQLLLANTGLLLLLGGPGLLIIRKENSKDDN